MLNHLCMISEIKTVKSRISSRFCSPSLWSDMCILFLDTCAPLAYSLDRLLISENKKVWNLK